MREILFRGKRIDSSEWIEGHYCYSPNLLAHRIEWYKMESFGAYQRTGAEVIPETVGQYTGLTDKNGKKIFEGDIVINDYGGESVVDFCTDDIASCGCCYEAFSGSGFKAQCTHMYDTHVVGNIYDNPELIGGVGDD